MPLNLTISGINGRMGRNVLRGARNRDEYGEINGVDREGGEIDGAEIYPSNEALDALERTDVVIDFSAPEGIEAALDACLKRNVPLVTGTTGLSKETQRRIEEASSDIPVLQSFNFAVGVNVFWKAVEEIASNLPGFDYEVVDIHHRHKRDSPSGTALTTVERIENEIGDREVIHGREGEAQRGNEIGVHSLRAGEIIGVHKVLAAGRNEEVELTHRAGDRSIFSEGALDAGVYLSDKEPGLYDMDDLMASLD